MPTRARSCTTSIFERVDVLAVELDVAVTRAPAMVSFIRLRQRRKVDLPQPDGPMKAVTLVVVDVDRDVLQRLLVAVEDADVARAHLGRTVDDVGSSVSVGVGTMVSIIFILPTSGARSGCEDRWRGRSSAA